MKKPSWSSAIWSSGSCASPRMPRSCWTGWTSWTDGRRRCAPCNELVRAQEGTEVDFFLAEDAVKTQEDTGIPDVIPAGRRIRVFTTRVDTIFGATSVQLAPEHPMVKEMVDADAGLRTQVAQLLEEQRKATRRRCRWDRETWRADGTLCHQSV